MNLFAVEVIEIVEELRGEHDDLQARSHRALRNMLEYLQARVEQLNFQSQYLNFRAQQECDLEELLEIWRRSERAQANRQRFAQRCLCVELELSRRGKLIEATSKTR